MGVWENGKRLYWIKESEIEEMDADQEESSKEQYSQPHLPGGLGVVEENSQSQLQSQSEQNSQSPAYQGEDNGQQMYYNRESDQLQ